MSANSSRVPRRATGRTFFFDTSVWIYMFGPLIDPNNRSTKLYSGFYKSVLQGNAKIVIDCLVVAEFSNRYLRDLHKFHKQTASAPDNFKQFRKTQEYRDSVTGLADELAHILDACVKMPLEFSLDDLSKWIDEFSELEIDFNDVIFWKTCVQHKLVLVTDDSDSEFGDIDIVTANRRLYQALS